MGVVRNGSLEGVQAGAIGSVPVRMGSGRSTAIRSGFKMKMKELRGNDPLLTAIAVAAILLYTGGSVFADSYDNDVWFFLATGDHILEHGIPYTNPFSVHEGLGFVAQQWLHCVISSLLYHAGGFALMGVWTSVLFLALAASLFVLGCTLRRARSGSETVMVLVALCAIGASAYASVRPHLYSMIAFTWIVWACESYRKSGNVRFLVLIPLIACVHVNLHAAIAPYDLFIIACYALPDVSALAHRRGKLLGLRFVGASYPRTPLLVVLVVSALALLVNPYGIQGALYLFLSFGSADYRNHINEMKHFTPASDWQSILVTALMFAVAVVAARLGGKRVNAPLLILAAAAIIGALAYLRNQWISCLFCFAYLAWALRGARFCLFKDGRAVKGFAVAVVLAAVVGMVALMVHAAPELEEKPVDSASTPVKGVEYLDRIGVDKETTRVFTFFNAGGFLEYHGFKVNVDPRPEIWNSAINGMGHDYYFEYVQMATGEIVFNTYNATYDFDVFFIDGKAGTDPYFTDNEDYVRIQSGDGYTVYAKRTWYGQYVS